jgi:octaprenyl-diphosphate synthase
MSVDTSIVALQRPVRRQLDLVQDRLQGLFRTPIPILNQVGGHVLATRGKKFRPTLLLLTAKLRGHLGEDAVVCATVVELVHAAALIHDDSVDNGHNTAMSIMARVVSEMSCGEALEFQHAYDLEVTETQYEDLIRAKTGSLIGAATEIGAGLNGGARDVARRERYRKFGEKVGVAFQIVDDLFDYLSDPAITGKPVGYDLVEGKVTLPLIAALRLANERDRKRLLALAGRKRWTPTQWTSLTALIERAGGFRYARERAAALAEESRELLAGEPASSARRALDAAVDYAVQRDH